MDKPVVLIILDGWGISDETSHNAIAQANTPQWDSWWQHYPHSQLDACGHYVGLPQNQMGNSEVGHMHIGAGRIIAQDFTRINQAIERGHFEINETLVNAINSAKQNGKALHLIGLLSEGGVHSHQNHLFALLKLCHDYNFDNVMIQLILDGRDTPPQSAISSIEALEQQLNTYPVGKIRSLCGRYYAMDRDKRWQRIEPVYDMLTRGMAEHQADSAINAVKQAYANNLSDEFIPPYLIGEAIPLTDGDSVLFYNFRADRVRQLCYALTEADFNEFYRQVIPDINLITMTCYAKDLDAASAFPPPQLKNTIGEVISQKGLRQLRLAETEKYAHVTFFLNGGNEVVYPGEDRVLIPSPRVATYDLKPEMSAIEVTNVLIESITNHDHDVIICNYANADMVGHSGDITATIQAIETLDQCFQRLATLVEQGDAELLITADHGNAESMFNPKTGQAHTAHTNQPVPLLFVGSKATTLAEKGSLIDVAPTLLHLLNIAIPEQMQGKPIFERLQND